MARVELHKDEFDIIATALHRYVDNKDASLFNEIARAATDPDNYRSLPKMAKEREMVMVYKKAVADTLRLLNTAMHDKADGHEIDARWANDELDASIVLF